MFYRLLLISRHAYVVTLTKVVLRKCLRQTSPMITAVNAKIANLRRVQDGCWKRVGVTRRRRVHRRCRDARRRRPSHRHPPPPRCRNPSPSRLATRWVLLRTGRIGSTPFLTPIPNPKKNEQSTLKESCEE